MTSENDTQLDIESNLKKYEAGLQIIFEGARADTGQTPKEIICPRPSTPRSTRRPSFTATNLQSRSIIQFPSCWFMRSSIGPMCWI